MGRDSNGIDPVEDTVTLRIANFTMTIPAGSFRTGRGGVYTLAGRINNVLIEVLIKPLSSNRFWFETAAYTADLRGTKYPVTVGLAIGDDSGTTSVNAVIRYTIRSPSSLTTPKYGKLMASRTFWVFNPCRNAQRNRTSQP